ncbi:4-aminobutyrate aminotransferase [Candidatus Hakubella thermalkaliphila]|uniref:alanine--glyoxylate transaminase n=1 Tax=Candidatus Hakubella thermalkaliphila TaxID=2754717 RepID=A0A6V8NJN6_9ACTN|nr:aspartate aminotransferase family protein [Candidatus Hakubella thermalkaliphila]GFP18726.1 4-aminobutyrate aminotransferase [Candidatus Hakubella thermalkaliphila]GFP29084.1 4-aminobutyrate aminotransferase [Candidatus Hakubella thermalkaliphila]GFP40047.1 4-aminobutyrate aminotransferase [Candidatus Hakubella thermalkaliphila]
MNYLVPCVASYYEEPIVMDRGEGQYLYDIEGRKYLDFFGGILTISVGHCNEEVTKKIAAQSHKLGHTSTLYPNIPMVSLAERVARMTPGKLQKSFFTNSGSEAVEVAVILARLYTGQGDIIALRHCYSGGTLLAMNITAHSNWRLMDTAIPGIKHAHNAYCYRCAFGREYPSCNLECAKDMEELIKTTTCGAIAGFIAEPIQGIGGFITPPKEYFQEVVPIIRKYGGLFICDEIQTGWGRTGTKMFGIEHWGVESDIMIFAKGTANGFPIGITTASSEVANSLSGSHISTFGGNPVACVAALATLDIIERDHLAQNAQVVGSYLRDKLENLKEKYAIVGDVRGMGLMQALEIVRENKEPAPDLVLQIFEETKKRGLLIGKGGLYGNVIRIAPPLTIGKADVDEAAKILDQSLSQIT